MLDNKIIPACSCPCQARGVPVAFPVSKVATNVEDPRDLTWVQICIYLAPKRGSDSLAVGGILKLRSLRNFCLKREVCSLLHRLERASVVSLFRRRTLQTQRPKVNFKKR
jgi:hypothetical protein